MSQATVRVEISQVEGVCYDVVLTDLASVPQKLSSEAVLITDSNLARHYPEFLANFGKAIVITAGEASKSGDQFLKLHQSLSESGLRRNSCIVAFGGGVVGDLAGFVASTYARGVEFVQIPTSLLAMVDSSVGGKVGIDLPGAKNMVGAFYHPAQVLVPVDTLRTLPADEFANGCAEILKCGLIHDKKLWDSLCDQALTVDSPHLFDVIRRCIEIKAEIIAKDPLEKTGLRATLNFGHTIGHAVEQCSGYQIPHGSAVAIGMLAEVEIGKEIGMECGLDVGFLRQILKNHGLPGVPHLALHWEEMRQAMKRDKKVTGTDLAFSLLTGVGECKLVANVPEEAVQRVLARLWH